MIKTSVLILTVLVISACGDNGSSVKDSSGDSLQHNPSISPQSPTDSGDIKGDTALYQRMPNKMNDSTPK